MYINSYKYIFSDHLELPDLFNDSFDQVQAIENIKNSLKRSAEDFEFKNLTKKTKLVVSTNESNLSYATETNDISYAEQLKNSSSTTNEVSEIIEKTIESLYAQKSPIEEDQFQKIIEEFYECTSINKEITIESQISNPLLLSSAFNSELYIEILKL